MSGRDAVDVKGGWGRGTRSGRRNAQHGPREAAARRLIEGTGVSVPYTISVV